MILLVFALATVAGLVFGWWLDTHRIRQARRLEIWFPGFAEYRREQHDAPQQPELWQELLDRDRDSWS